MPESPKQLKVFLCHSSNDKPVVRDLYQRLSAEGWMDVWLDEEKLFPGYDWNLEIEKAVEAADAILVCLSNNSVTKEGYVQRELRIVLDYADYKPEGTLYLIPVRLEACDPPRRLRPWQYADYFPAEGRARAYERLLVSLRMRAAGLGIATEPYAAVKRAPAAQLKSPERGVAKTISDENKLEIGGMEFRRVPKGVFIIGSNDDDKDAYDNEKPQHTVDIPYDYWVARFPVTNGQYGAFVKSSGGKHPIIGWEKNKDDPLVWVSWEDAQVYVKWLNASYAVDLPEGYIYRLPTEAEWEKAARGPYGNIYPWGNEFDPAKCNSYKDKPGGITPVGACSPQGDSPYGCADMAGNVWEWTHSLFEKYPYQVNNDREHEKKEGARVLRGGSFGNSRYDVRCALRNRYGADNRSDNIGFRVSLAPSLDNGL